MIRIATSLIFLLTLFCPIFCLAGDGGDCPDHGRSDARNCEAMSVGALVLKSEIGTTLLTPLLLCLDQLPTTEPVAIYSRRSSQVVAWNRANTKPPPASIRQAHLQSFLF